MRNFPREVHGGGTQTWDVDVGPDAWIYAANNDGLLVFNGLEWSVHPQPRRTVLRSLVLADNGTVYAGGQGELGCYAPDKDGRLVYHSLLTRLPQELRGLEDVWDLCLFEDRLYWRSSGMVYSMGLEDGQLQGQDSAEIYRFDDRVVCLRVVGERLMAYVREQGFFRWSGDASMENPFEPWLLGEMLPEAHVTGMVQNEEGAILISTLKNGLFKWTSEHGISAFAKAWTAWFSEHRVYASTQLSDGRLVMGTTTAGVCVMSPDGNMQAVYDREAGLQNNNVLALVEDAHGNLWMGMDNGIDMLSVGSSVSRVMPDAPLDGSGYAMAQLEGRFYFGTNNGLYVFDPQKPWSERRFRFVEGSRGQVWSLMVSEGQLLVGHHEGAFRLNGNRLEALADFGGCWRFMELPLEAAGEGTSAAIENKMLLAGSYDGLHGFVWQHGQWKHTGKLEGFDESARLMAFDPQAHLWIAHPYKGLWRIALDGLRLTEVQALGAAEGLPDLNGVQVFQVAGDAVFTLPEQGAWRFDAANRRFVRHEHLAEFIGEDQEIRAILPGEGEDLWCATKNTMHRLSITDKGLEKEVQSKAVPALAETLLPGFEFLYDPPGQAVFAASERGFVQFLDRSRKRGNRSPKLHLLGVEAGKRLDSLVFAGYGVMDSTEHAFPTYMRSLRFRFAATEFETPERVRYAWRLDGYDANWSPWSHETSKEFTNLQPGSYRFEVLAMDGEGKLMPAAGFAFHIAKPWYATSLAYVAYLLIITGSLSLLVLAPQRRFAREKVRLQSEKEQTLKEQEAKHQQTVESRERALDALRSEKLQSEIDHQNRQLAMSTMHLVQKNAMITKIKEEVARVEKDVEHPEVRKTVRSVLQLLNSDHRLDEDWEQFSMHFDKVHTDFLGRLRQHFPQLTPKDQKLCAFLRLNLSSKEIAPLLNISIRGVEISRYRLRKKLELETEVNLVDFLLGI